MSKLDGKVDYDMNELKGNFNALLYMVTETMAVSLEILKKLHEKELLTAEDTDAVLEVTGNKQELTRVYNEVFTRFVGYYQAIMRTIIEEQEAAAVTPAENLVQGEEITDAE